MSIIEVIPIVESLPHTDKFKLMQFLLVQLAKEEGISLQKIPQSQQQDPLWDIIGMADGEKADVARQHDKYLYSAPV